MHLTRLAATLLALAAATSPARAGIDFAREIRPIFSEHCFACHGPDAGKRKAGLRLDERASAFGKGESGESATQMWVKRL